MAGKRKPGAPRKLRDAAKRRKLLALIRRGVSFRVACANIGVCCQTVRNEALADPEFETLLEQAKSAKVVVLTDLVFEHAKTDPRTCMHLLSILDPAYVLPKEPQTHLHAHADVPPRVIFEIIDKRLGTDTDPPSSSPDASGFLE